MPNPSRSEPSWDTSSLGDPADVSALERVALADHLAHCGTLRGPLQALQTASDEMQGLLAGRFVTAVVFVTLLVGASWLAL